MKKALLLLPLFLLLVIPSALRSEDAKRPAAKLTVTIKDIRNHKGNLIFGVFTSQDGFPTAEAKAFNWQVKAADADSVTFTVDLPPGDYAASVLHDENKNGQMDKNLVGIPKEGCGATNNVKPRRRGATFKEAKFILPAAGATQTISMQYEFL